MPAFHGLKPGSDRRVPLTEVVGLVVVKAGAHALDVGREHHIGGAEAFEEVGAGGGSEGAIHPVGHPIEGGGGDLFRARRQARPAEPEAPGAKQLAFQLAQGQHAPIPQTIAEGPEGLLQRRQDVVAFGVEAAVKVDGGQHAGGHQAAVPGLLFAVAEHRDLADPVRDPLFLQPQPNLLAIGAPGVVIPEQGDAHGTFGLPEQAQQRLGVARTVHPVGGLRCQGFQLRPAQRNGEKVQQGTG